MQNKIRPNNANNWNLLAFSESFIHWIVQGNSKKSQEVASFGLLVGGGFVSGSSQGKFDNRGIYQMRIIGNKVH